MTDETSSDNQQSMPNDVGEIIHGNSNHLPLLGSESTNAPTNSQTAGPALSSPFSSVMDQLHALDSTHSELTHMKNVDPTAAVTEQWPNGDKDTTFVRTNTVTETRTDSPNPNPSHTVESLPVPPVLPNGNAKLHGILRRPSSASSTASSGVRLDQLANTVDSKPFYTVELNNGHPKATSPTCVVNNNFLSPEWNPSGFDHAGHVGNGGANGSAVHPTFSLGGREPDSMNGSVMGSQMLEKHASFADMTGLAQVATKKPSVVQRLFRKKEVPRSFTMEDLRKEINMDDHIIPVEDVFRKLQVDPTTGLTEEEAKIRLDRDGKNELTPPKQVPEIVKFLREMVGGFSPLLLTGSLLCFIAFFVQLGAMGGDVPFDNLYLAVVLFVVVIITGVFLYAQKAKSQRIMESFKKMLPQHATVIRNGKENSILAEDLVLGDIVEIRGGDRVPADVRILDAKGLKVDNSSLTGESEAQSRKPIPSENPLESKNLCFYTTNAVEGWGRGIVIRRGDQTFMGRIARLTMRLGESDTTIAREIAAFVWLISIVAVLMGVICVIIPLSMGYDFLTTVILAIGLIVANVPEGIVIAVTVMLTLTAQKMAKKNCLIKNLEAVETLGSCSIICTDKTGTLTQNRMTVAHCWVDNTVVPINTVIENLAGKDLPDSQTVRDLVRVATLCNRAHFKSDQPDGPIYSRTVVGDASESALLKFVEAVDGHPEDARQKHVPVVEIPFNSTTKFQVSIHEMEPGETAAGDKRYLLVMKGAPEQIWARCTTISCQGEDFDINQEWATKFNDAYRSLGGLGERVLGFCDLLLPLDVPTTFDAENPNFPLEGLRFLGLFSLIDPPRSAVPDAVAKCRSAGIRIIMVTGDHPVTAKAIGRGVGIISEQSETVEDISERLGIKVEDVDPRDANAVVVHGDRLRSMSVDEIVTILQTHPEVIFARTSPQQKLTIVEACQKMGAVVAVTGDGVNDSPALKKANIGIAMGITGSDVSKQAADMVLLDDNFASIVTGVEEGRLIFDNLKKTICYSIMSNVPEIVPIVLYFILSIPLGLTTIPMLLLCLVTDLIPAISMAHESAEGDIMKLPPRDIHDRLVNSRLIHGAYLQAGIICATGAFFSYLVVFAECGFYPQRLLGLRADWENPRIMDLKDSFGQEWTYAQRMTLQRSVSSAFFVGVVVFQWSDIVMRKMRRKSIFQKGMRNWFLNCAILVETLLAVICVYTPCLNTALTLHDIKFLWWIPVMPFGLLFCVLDEIRRFFIRCYPGGWVEKEFYF